MSRRTRRVEETFKEELSEIIQRELKDPRVGFVTITEVKVSPDLRKARVYVSMLGTEEEAEATLAGMESAKSYMRLRLGKHLRMKVLPEIEFVRERTAEEAVELEKLLKKTREEDGEGDR